MCIGTMFCWTLAVQGLSAAEPTLVMLDRDPLLDRAIFQRMASHPDHHIRFAESGAASSNVDWEKNPDKPWYIEAQRYGGDLVEAGLLTNNPRLVDLGWTIIDWGFARQASDGGFGDTGDPFHSTSFFVEATARALLVARQLSAPDAEARAEHYGPKLAAAARWMREPRVIDRGLKNNRPYAHRRWLLAAAWGEAAGVLHDAALDEAAEQQARDGLALQQGDGVNPEKDGFDVSYQAVGLLMAERYLTVCNDARLRASIRKMLSKGLDCELEKIDASGAIDSAGSTRVNSETGRSGAAKTVDHKAIVFSLIYGAKLLNRPDCYVAAERVTRNLRWIKD